VELVTYIVSPMMIGVDSWLSRVPSECAQTTLRSFTLAVFTCFSVL